MATNYKKTAILQELEQAIQRKVTEKSRTKDKFAKTSQYQPQITQSVEYKKQRPATKSKHQNFKQPSNPSKYPEKALINTTQFKTKENDINPYYDQHKINQNNHHGREIVYSSNRNGIFQPQQRQSSNKVSRNNASKFEKSQFDGSVNLLNSVKNTFELIDSSSKNKLSHNSRNTSASNPNKVISRKWEKFLSIINYHLSSSEKAVKFIDKNNFEADFAIKLYKSDHANLLNEIKGFNIEDIVNELKPKKVITNNSVSDTINICTEATHENLEEENIKLKKQVLLLQKQVENFHQFSRVERSLKTTDQGEEAIRSNFSKDFITINNAFSGLFHPETIENLIEISERQQKFKEIVKNNSMNPLQKSNQKNIQQMLKSFETQKYTTFVNSITTAAINHLQNKHLNSINAPLTQRSVQLKEAFIEKEQLMNQIEELKRDVESLKEFQAVKEHNSSLQQRNQWLEKQIAELKENIVLIEVNKSKEFNDLNQQLEKQRAEYETRIANLTKKNQQHLSDTQAKQSQSIETIEYLKRRLASLEEELYTQEKVLSRLKESEQTYNMTVAEIKKQEESKSSQLQEAYRSSVSKLAEKEERQQQLESQIRSNGLKLQLIRKEMEEKDLQLLALERQLAEVNQNKIQPLCEEIERLTQKSQSLQLQIEERSKQYQNSVRQMESNHRLEVARINDLMQTAKSELCEKEEEFKSYKDTGGSKVDEQKEQEVKRLAESSNQLYQENILLEQKCERLQKELESEKEHLQSKCRRLNEAISSKEAQNVGIKSHCQQLKSKIELLESELSLVKQSLSKKLEGVSAQKQLQIEQLKEELNFFENQAVKREQELKDKDLKISGLEAQLIDQSNQTAKVIEEGQTKKQKLLREQQNYIQILRQEWCQQNEEFQREMTEIKESHQEQESEYLEQISDLKETTEKLIQELQNQVYKLTQSKEALEGQNQSKEQIITGLQLKIEEMTKQIETIERKLNDESQQQLQNQSKLQSENITCLQNQIDLLKEQYEQTLRKQKSHYEQQTKNQCLRMQELSIQLNTLDANYEMNLRELTVKNQQMSQQNEQYTETIGSLKRLLKDVEEKQEKQLSEKDEQFNQKLNQLKAQYEENQKVRVNNQTQTDVNQQKFQENQASETIKIHNLKIKEYIFFVKKILQSTNIEFEDLENQTDLDVLLSVGSQRIVKMKRRLRDEESNRKKMFRESEGNSAFDLTKSPQKIEEQSLASGSNVRQFSPLKECVQSLDYKVSITEQEVINGQSSEKKNESMHSSVSQKSNKDSCKHSNSQQQFDLNQFDGVNSEMNQSCVSEKGMEIHSEITGQQMGQNSPSNDSPSKKLSQSQEVENIDNLDNFCDYLSEANSSMISERSEADVEDKTQNIKGSRCQNSNDGVFDGNAEAVNAKNDQCQEFSVNNLNDLDEFQSYTGSDDACQSDCSRSMISVSEGNQDKQKQVKSLEKLNRSGSEKAQQNDFEEFGDFYDQNSQNQSFVSEKND